MASADRHQDAERRAARKELHRALRDEVRQALEATLALQRLLDTGEDVAACDLQLLAARYLRAAALARAAEGGARLRLAAGGTA